MTAVSLSANEVQALSRKAAAGAGLAFGIAEDLGSACVWLSLNGVDAIAALLPGLYAGGQARAAFEGLAAIDRLVAGDAPEGITLAGIDAPLLLAGLAGDAADRLGVSIRLSLEGHEIDVPGSLGVLPVAGPVTIHMHLTEKRMSSPKTARRPAPTDTAALAAAERLAALTYVPASDQSRRGAGASATDND